MRRIDYIVLHCTATSKNTKISSIQKYWKEVMKWKSPGYHYIIEDSGKFTRLLDIEKIANGVAGFNSHSIHISYIGGVDSKGKALDNRSEAQKSTQIILLKSLKETYPNAEIKGHRDFPNVHKDCPSFDVKKWLKEVGL